MANFSQTSANRACKPQAVGGEKALPTEASVARRAQKPRSRWMHCRLGLRGSGDANTQLFVLNGNPGHPRTIAPPRAQATAHRLYHRRAVCKYCGRLFVPWQARPSPRAGAIRLSHSLKQHNTRATIRSWLAFHPHRRQAGNLHRRQVHHQVSRQSACRHPPLASGLLQPTRNWPRSRRRSRNGCATSDSVLQRSAAEASWRHRKQTCPRSTCGRL